MDEIQMLAAFANDHMKKSHSVRLSDLDASQMGPHQKKCRYIVVLCRAVSVCLESLQEDQCASDVLCAGAN